MIKLGNSCYIFLEDILYILGIGYTLILVKKLLGLKLIGQFNTYCILFSRRSNNVLLIEAKIRNSLYIVLQITKEVDSISFTISVKLVRPIIELDKITTIVGMKH